MVKSEHALFEEPCIREEVAVSGVTFIPHVLNVCKIPVEVVFDDTGVCFGWCIALNEAFSESV